MAAYISAVFEKTRLTTSEQIRVIVRNRDDGTVPPTPSTTYYPTQPDTLNTFVVGYYIDSSTGEQFQRIATAADITGITVRQLDIFEDTSANFAGVSAGDLIYVQMDDPQLWNSTEYTSSTPFVFQVLNYIGSTQLQVTRPFPSFMKGLSYTIPSHSLTGSTAVTRRTGLPANGTEFLDKRFNRLYPTVIEADTSVIAMKADIKALTNESAGATLVSEVITVSSTI